jgi:hypothetical protein
VRADRWRGAGAPDVDGDLRGAEGTATVRAAAEPPTVVRPDHELPRRMPTEPRDRQVG